MKITKQNTTHYNWGNKCSGWHLLQSPNLHIIEEVMPPNTEETKHYHNVSEQFFYILKGVATFEMAEETHQIEARQGIHILPKVRHQIKNQTSDDLEFIVISQPTTRGDRINAPFGKNPVSTFGESQNINLQNKSFKALSNSDNGEVSDETIFSYHQKEDIVWATYEGGDILFGTLSGKRTGNQLIFNYQHQNKQGDFLTGKCETIIKIINNRIQLHEIWQWTCRDFSSGTSVLIEV